MSNHQTDNSASDPEKRAEEAIQIPPGASPLRYMIAIASGNSYVAASSLAEARRMDDAVLIMETDCGGQILLTCPVNLIAADEDAMRRLLFDLESITWGAGFDPSDDSEAIDAAIHFEIAPTGSSIAGGMGGGRGDVRHMA